MPISKGASLGSVLTKLSGGAISTNGMDYARFGLETAYKNIHGDLKKHMMKESEDDETMAYIMKQVVREGEKEAVYEFVEDEKEINAVAGLLEELLDGEVELIPDDK